MGRFPPETASSFDEFKSGYLATCAEILLEMRGARLNPFLDLILEVQDRGAQLVFMGNGGMAATATHFAMGLSYVSGCWSRPIRALSICQDATVITSLANDWGYENIFSRQLEIQLRPGDAVVALSVSGRSANVVKAAEHARSRGHRVAGIVGTPDSPLSRLCNPTVLLDGRGGVQGLTEDAAMTLGHAICQYLALSQEPRAPR
jgi:D-sedoheptulose 7-phosphate isomerase